MSRKVPVVLAVLALGLMPQLARAQEEEAPRPYIYATYHECQLDQQWRADRIVRSVMAPAYDAVLADGGIQAWGWLAHHTGGKWRRVVYYAAPTLDALLDVPDLVDAKISDEDGPAADEIGKICPAHDDYIWRWVAGSGQKAFQERGEASFSTYYLCDGTKEQRADELMKEHLAAVFDSHVKEGELTSWGWWEHWVGGKWRRLMSLSGTDHKSLLQTRSALIGELVEKHQELMGEFSAICDSHQDFMWDIQIEKP